MNEKRNLAFDNARTYIGEALKKGEHTRDTVTATIMNYGLTKPEAESLMDIYGKELKTGENKNTSKPDSREKVILEKFKEYRKSNDWEESLKLTAKYSGESVNEINRLVYEKGMKNETKNTIGYKVGDEVDIETTGMASVGQKKQYNDGEGNNWWVQVTKVTKEGYIGNIIGKVGGTVNSAVTTDEERRNIGRDLYGSDKLNVDRVRSLAKSYIDAIRDSNLEYKSLSEIEADMHADTTKAGGMPDSEVNQAAKIVWSEVKSG